jgi:hypothetical protein
MTRVKLQTSEGPIEITLEELGPPPHPQLGKIRLKISGGSLLLMALPALIVERQSMRDFREAIQDELDE